MTGCQMNVFIFFLLVWKVGALDKEHDWTFGKPALNIAYNKLSNDSQAVDGDFETFARLTGDPPQWWAVDLGAVYTVAMIRMYPEVPEGSFHALSTTTNIAIWSSTAEIPGSIFSSIDWKNVTSYAVVHGYGATADYQPPAQIRHLGVTTTENDLRISEFQVFAPMNLAQFSSITSSESFNLLSLVDGNYGGEVQMRAAGKKWIDFDLLEVYSIRMIEVFKCNDQEAKILTAKGNPAATLSQSEDGWTPNAPTSLGPAGEMKFEFFTPMLEVQRVALVSYKSSSSLTVAEVVVHEYNYALRREVTIMATSSFNGSFSSSASQVVDGNLNTFMERPRNVNATLSLDFGKMIIFRKALIYVKTGYCVDHQCSRWFFGKIINAITSGEDELCFRVTDSIGDSFVLECNKTVFHGLRIVSTDSSIELREIVVYGKELPTMDDTEFDAKRVDSTTVTLTFTQWNSNKPGSRPPDKYILRTEGNGTLDRTEFVHDGSGPIQTNITGTQRNDLISIYAECEIDGEKCAGRPAEVHYSLSDGKIVDSSVTVEMCPPREAVVEGSQARFQCIASCLQPISDCTVRWGFKTQSNRLPAGVILLNSSVIHFSPAVRGHSGRYYCWVEGFRQITTFAEFTVYPMSDGCRGNQYTCENGRRVFRDYLCNGNHDCADNSDKHASSSPRPTTSARPITSARPNKLAPTTEKVQNTTGIIVGVTLAVAFLVFVGIGAAIFIKKKPTTAEEEVANNNSNIVIK